MKKNKSITKNLLNVLQHKKNLHTPIWLMRQAGRYLPEYRALRKQAGSFMNLCFNPEMASAVTLQPVHRFNMDGAILFSDILVVPYGLGYKLEFIEGEGPKLEHVDHRLPAFKTKSFFERTAPIYETVRRTQTALKADVKTQHVTMIGFAGAPFTVACYMMGGTSANDFIETRIKAQQNPVFFEKLLNVLVEATVFYLGEQIKAGAEVIQLFDSWANIVPASQFEKWVIAPTQKIVSRLRKKYPHIPIIGFPRMAGSNLGRYASAVKPDGLSLDQNVDLGWAQKNISKKIILQGNLDPVLMLGDKKMMLRGAKQIMDAMDRPFIFNLGHGLTPQVPPENVAALVKFVQNYSKG